jgi:poly(hydroxyalkanoate) granule-associated protein
MLKKARAGMADKTGGGTTDMSQAVLDSSRHIWLAGLGAFSRAQAEGTKVFEALVRQGEKLESKTRRAAADTAAAARGAATAKVKEVKKGVGGTWDKLEQVFEQRVARALSKLGVHTHNDVQRLTERVDALSEAVNELIKATGVKAGRGGKAPAAAVSRTKAAAAKRPRKSARRPAQSAKARKAAA